MRSYLFITEMDINTEILYLARGGKEDIFVKKCPKQQNVVDGIRFLYRQYVKKKPGVILNDSHRHNKRTEIVLFVSAIQPVLDRPVLILCSEGDESKWREYFEIWTNMANDISTDTINPFAKKVSVYISPIQDVTKFYSREWSGVIVDSDVIHKEILKINISAKFRVWITDVDVKNDLTIFLQLYKWLYPKEKFDPNMFQCDARDPNDVVEKAILLDSFMEDVVLRTNDQEDTIVFQKSPETPKVTRKNKDATGTKIKRTKRKNRISSSEDDSPTKTSKTNETASNDNNHKNITLKNANISKIDSRLTIDKSKTTIDDFRVSINDTKTTINDLSSTINDTGATINDTRATNIDDSRSTIDYTRANIDDRTTYDILSNRTVDSSKIHIEYYDEDKTNDQRDEVNEMAKKSPIICDEDDNSMDLLLKYEVDEKYTPLAFDKNNGDEKPESNDSAYDKETQENFDEIVKIKDTECRGSNKNVTKSNDKNIVSNEMASNNQIIKNTNKVENEIDLKRKELTKDVKESENLFSTESMRSLNKITKQQITLNTNKNELDLKRNEISKETELHSENLFSTESLSTLNKIANENDEVKGGVANNKTDPSSSLDTKIKQMEAHAMKKFKGSLLDSIF